MAAASFFNESSEPAMKLSLFLSFVRTSFFSYFLDIILRAEPISFKSYGCVGSLGSDMVIVIYWNSEYGCG